jgi:hypothetical protein
MAWDPDFKPNKMDNVLKVWSLKGLQISSQIITKYEVNPFDVILKKYDLVQSNFYKYLQLRKTKGKYPELKMTAAKGEP